MTTHPIRTVAVTQSDPFFTGRFFAQFLKAAPAAGVELVEVVLLRNFNESRLALLRRFARFYGPIDLLRLSARYGRARVAERQAEGGTVEAVASHHGVPVRRLASINDQTYLQTLAARDVDVLLSVAAPELFGREALAAAPYVLNVHNGQLPDYRGMMPTFWALLDGQPHVMVTVHEMVEELDAGRVLGEFPVRIERQDSAFDVSRKAKAVAGIEVAQLLSRIGSADWPEGRLVDARAGSYRGFPDRTDVRRLRRRGRRLL